MLGLAASRRGKIQLESICFGMVKKKVKKDEKSA